MRNVLFIKLRYIGDVLLVTPTVRALKAAQPHVRVSLLVHRGTEDVVLNNPDLEEIMILDKKSLINQWRVIVDLPRRQFDTVVDFTDGDRSAFLSWVSGAPVRIGFNTEHRWRGRCYTQVVQPMLGAHHRITRDLSALKLLGINGVETSPKLFLTEADERAADQLLDQIGLRRDRPIIVIQPGARYWFKAWPYERFAELADCFASEYGAQVLVGGTQAEKALAHRIHESARSHPISIAGVATLKQFAAITKRARLFVGNDTGAMHIATAVGTPVLGLFGPSNPNEWGPRGGEVRILYKGFDCRTCFHPTCTQGERNCMKQISVREVYAAAVELLAGNISQK